MQPAFPIDIQLTCLATTVDAGCANECGSETRVDGWID